jgi:hypothetical protein
MRVRCLAVFMSGKWREAVPLDLNTELRTPRDVPNRDVPAGPLLFISLSIVQLLRLDTRPNRKLEEGLSVARHKLTPAMVLGIICTLFLKVAQLHHLWGVCRPLPLGARVTSTFVVTRRQIITIARLNIYHASIRICTQLYSTAKLISRVFQGHHLNYDSFGTWKLQWIQEEVPQSLFILPHYHQLEANYVICLKKKHLHGLIIPLIHQGPLCLYLTAQGWGSGLLTGSMNETTSQSSTVR